MTVARILRGKRDTVFALHRRECVQQVVDTFAARRADAVVVLNDSHGMEGVIYERDVIRALSGNASAAMRVQAEDIMTRNVTTCSYNTREADIMKIMVEQSTNALPILTEGLPVGLVSMRDVLKLRLEKIAHLMKEVEKECQMFHPPHDSLLFQQ